MSFSSFYGGRQGASFIIVKQFDGLDIPQIEGSYVYKIKYLATTIDKQFLIYNNGFIEKNADNYNDYIWKAQILDGSTVDTKPDAEGEGPTSQQVLDIAYAEGMRQCFEQGGDTTDIVNYGEYVIIDTIDKNNPDNGKVYRRGINFDYNPDTNPLAGAEYIGQIVGPKGDSPELELAHYQDIIDEYGDVAAQLEYDEANEDLVQGSYIENGVRKYNDEIKWDYVTLKDEFNNIYGCKLGFKLPTLVVDFEANSVSPYYNGIQDPETGQWSNTNLIVEDEEEWDGEKWQHSFFQKWQIKIPQGIHGQDMDNLQIIHTKTMPAGFESREFLGAEVYVRENDEFISTSIVLTDSYPLDIDAYDTPFVYEEYEEKYNQYDEYVRLDDQYYIPGSDYYVRKDQCYMDVIRYKEINYDNNPAELTFYQLGDYNDIRKISLSREGVLTVFYSAIPEPQNLEETLKWLDTTTLNSIIIDNDGSIHVYYNTTHDPVGSDVDPYERIDGSGQAHDHSDYPKVLDWISEAVLSAEGDFKIIYNNNTVKIGTDPNTGLPIYGDTYETTLQWINHIEITPEGTLNFYYCNNLTWDPATQEPNTPDFSFEGYLKVIKDIDIETHDPSVLGSLEGTGDQKVHITYNTMHETAPGSGVYENDTDVIGNPLNYIIETVIYEESAYNNNLGNNQQKIDNKELSRGHLLVYYSDPELRKRLGTSDPTATPVVYDKWISYPSIKLGQDLNEWIDLGQMTGLSGGIHIIKYISDINELKEGGDPDGDWIPPEEIMDATGYYAVGTEGRGWSVILKDGTTRDLYCFDYELKEWFNYGPLDSNEPREVIILSAPDPNSQDHQSPVAADVGLLKTNGFWLAEENGVYVGN